MKFVSLNCRGLESTWKKLSLKRMMEVLSPEVILPQETMGLELEVETSLTSLLLQYSFTTQSAIGHSGGLEIGWKKTSIRCTNSRGACLYLNQSHFFSNFFGPGNWNQQLCRTHDIEITSLFFQRKNLQTVTSIW